MMLESLLPTLENIWDVSLFVLVVGVVLFYFGKLICDAKIWEYEKADYYIHGLGFTINYVIIPFILVLILNQFINWYFPIWLSLISTIVICSVLASGVVFNLGKYRLFTLFKPAFEEKVDESKVKSRVEAIDKKFGTTASREISEYTQSFFQAQKTMAGLTESKIVLFIFSVLTIWITFSTYTLEPFFSLASVLIYLLAFFVFTFIAVQFGYSGLIKPIVRIVLDNGLELGGRLLKAGKYIVIIKEDEKKTISVNPSKIKYIEGRAVETPKASS